MKNYTHIYATLVLCTILGQNLMASIYSGTCGPNLNWSLNTTDSLLSITGSGNMYDYGVDSEGYLNFPWTYYVADIYFLQISEGVTSIGDSAFSCLSELKKVDFPISLKRIGVSAFSYCVSLDTINIPNSVEYIGDNCFAYCSNLKLISIGRNINKIPNRCFKNCVKLDNVHIGPIDTIGVAAFYADSALSSITFEEGVSLIDSSAFRQCVSLKHINLPHSTQCISTWAFVNSGLQSFICPEGLISIQQEAFASCMDLETFHLSSSVRDFSYKVPLFGCSKLTTITVDESNYTYYCPPRSNAIIQRSNNALIQACMNTVIPPSVSRITRGAFSRTNLSRLSIPNSVKVIEDQAFAHMDFLRVVEIGSGVETIGGAAFDGCNTLDTIRCSASVPPLLGAYVWNNIDVSHVVLLVPLTSVSLYQSSEQWEDFDISPFTVSVTTISQETTQLSWQPVDSASLYQLHIYTDSTCTITLDTTLYIAADSLNGGILQQTTSAPARIKRIVLDDIGTVVVISIDPSSGTSVTTPFVVTVSTTSSDEILFHFDINVYSGDKIIKEDYGIFKLNDSVLVPTSFTNISSSPSLPTCIYDLQGHQYSPNMWSSLPSGMYIWQCNANSSKVIKR